jgi:hypothetical protein
MMRPRSEIGQALIGWASLIGLAGLATLGLMGMGHI